jgi:4-hydroxy-tetrahydrodipicolinate reductase
LVIACEAIFGASDERLTIRHDAPYVAGTLLAVRRVGEQVGLRRGLDSL